MSTIHKFVTLNPITGKVPPRTSTPPATYKPSGKEIFSTTDLGYMFGPHEDQGAEGSCTAFASTQWYSEWLERQGKPWTEYSEAAQYFEERKELGTTNEDSGAYGHNAVDVLENDGVMAESDDPYAAGNFTQAPDETKFIKGSQLQSDKVRQIPDQYALPYTLDALTNGFPVLFGFTVFPELESSQVASNGIVPMPQAGEQPIGGHEVIAIGHDSTRQLIKCRNQWGATWGDKGDFWLPFDYFTQYVSELYVIVDPAPTPTPSPSPTPQPQPQEKIELWLGNQNIVVNGQTVQLDVIPLEINGHTTAEIRPIFEKLGYTVAWDEAEKKVTITK